MKWKWDEGSPHFSVARFSQAQSLTGGGRPPQSRALEHSMGVKQGCAQVPSTQSVRRLLSPAFLPPGLRGAIPYALSLHLDLEPMEKRQLIGTTTIVLVLFTILLLGGSTMPLIRLMDIEDAKARRRSKKDVNLSKTEKMVSGEGTGSVAAAAGRWGNETRFEALGTRTHSKGVELEF